MRMLTQEDYPASPQAVFAVFTDPSFVTEKAAKMSVGEHSGAVRTEGEQTIITTSRTLPTTDMPEIAQRFVGPVLTLLEEQNWGPVGADGRAEGTLRLTVAGFPVTVTGAMTLTATATGARQEVDADLAAKVPLMGGTIEKAAAPAIEAGMALEADMLREWLAR